MKSSLDFFRLTNFWINPIDNIFQMVTHEVAYGDRKDYKSQSDYRVLSWRGVYMYPKKPVYADDNDNELYSSSSSFLKTEQMLKHSLGHISKLDKVNFLYVCANKIMLALMYV